MTKDEALRLALRAMVVNNYAWKYLAESGDAGNFEAEEQGYYQLNEKAITAVEAVLEAKVEPVAWRTYTGRGYYIIEKTLEEAERNWPDKPHTPLYTTPPQRKPLTDDELLRLLSKIDECTVRLPRGLREFARAIEAAHGIKGEA